MTAAAAARAAAGPSLVAAAAPERPPTADAAQVDRENPWPGLLPFTESAEAFFKGREAETAELAHLVRREPITVLHGRSGMGKSSLLLAGLFPQLRRDDYLPVYVRLDHAPSSAPFEEQVLARLFAVCDQDGVEYRPDDDGLGLWAYLHHVDSTFWSTRNSVWSAGNRVLTPVLVLDQFEELFTIGTRARAEGLFGALAELVDNRPPRAVRELVAGAPAALKAYDLDRVPCRIVLGIREDYLSALTGLRRRMNLTLQSYFDLQAMDGDQALDAVLKSGGHLVDAPVAERIVRALASLAPGTLAAFDKPSRAGAADAGAPVLDALRADEPPSDGLSDLRVDPALLSMVCREYNDRRQRPPGRERITADLLDEEPPGNIIARYYHDSFAGLDPRVQVFVEERLLDERGFRDSVPRSDVALRYPGVTDAAVDYLIDRRRLLHVEARLDAPRIELTHDVLTVPARASRDARRRREKDERAREELAADRRKLEQEGRRREEQRRAAVWRWAALAAALALLIFAWLAVRATRASARAERETQQATIQKNSADQARADAVRLSKLAMAQRDAADAARRADSASQVALHDTVESLVATRDSVRRAEQEARVAREAADRYIRVSDFRLGELQDEIRRNRDNASTELRDATARRDTAKLLVARYESLLDSAKRDQSLLDAAKRDQPLLDAARRVLCSAPKDARAARAPVDTGAVRAVRAGIEADLNKQKSLLCPPVRGEGSS